MKHAATLGALGLVITAAAATLPSCADNESTLAIRGVLALSADTCTTTADPSAELQFNGIIDTALAGEYTAMFLVMNQLVPRGDPNLLRTETARVQLVTADVRIQDTTGTTITRSDGSAGEFTVPIVGFADPGTGTTPGYGSAAVTLIDPGTVADLAAQSQQTGLGMDLLVKVIIHGHTLGGTDVETGEFTFPLHACYGCLVDCPGKAVDPTFSPQNCKNMSEDPTPNCRIGRDRPVDCRLCQGNPACGCGA
jgi:hypothetical protein